MRIRLLLVVLVVTISVGGPAPAQQSAKSAGGTHANKNEAEIRALWDQWAKAFKARDLDGIMALFAPGDAVVAYDIVPPLQYAGKDAYRKDYAEFLAQYVGPIEVEYRDMRVVADAHVAFIHALERLSGTMKNGQKTDLWLRATSGLRKIDGKWLILHDHVSVPVDFDSGKALLDLKP